MFLFTAELPIVQQPNWENVMKKPIILAAVAFITCGVTVAQAGSAFEPRAVTVRFADIDTASPQGAAVLYRRLKGAAASVCQDLEPAKELARVHVYISCIRTALSSAIVKVDRPALSVYAAAHGLPTGDSAMRIADNK
jgi:UrcA family protein